MDLAAQKKRLTAMLAIDGVCAVVAIASLLAAFNAKAAWGWPVFVIAIGAGVAAQVWFVLGFKKGAS